MDLLSIRGTWPNSLSFSFLLPNKRTNHLVPEDVKIVQNTLKLSRKPKHCPHLANMSKHSNKLDYYTTLLLFLLILVTILI
jgi:hypothetical protein